MPGLAKTGGMPFADDDKTVHDGESVEVYRFTSPLGVFRYASWQEDFAFADGFTYQAVPVARSDYQEGDSGRAA